MYNSDFNIRIEEILRDRGISKNKLCKDLNIPRPNFNKFCAGKAVRYDKKFLLKLCKYLQVGLSDLMVFVESEIEDN